VYNEKSVVLIQRKCCIDCGQVWLDSLLTGISRLEAIVPILVEMN